MSELTQYRLFIENDNAYKHKIYNYFFFRLNHDVPLAEDLTSDTFTKAYGSLETFKIEYEFSTWIYAIARNVLTDHFRRSAIRQTEELLDDIEDDTASFIEAIDTNIDIERIREEIDQLPPAQSQAVKMRYFDYKEIDQIALISESNPDAVRKNISRGLETLRKLLAFLIVLIQI